MRYKEFFVDFKDKTRFYNIPEEMYLDWQYRYVPQNLSRVVFYNEQIKPWLEKINKNKQQKQFNDKDLKLKDTHYTLTHQYNGHNDELYEDYKDMIKKEASENYRIEIKKDGKTESYEKDSLSIILYWAREALGNEGASWVTIYDNYGQIIVDGSNERNFYDEKIFSSKKKANQINITPTKPKPQILPATGYVWMWDQNILDWTQVPANNNTTVTAPDPSKINQINNNSTGAVNYSQSSLKNFNGKFNKELNDNGLIKYAGMNNGNTLYELSDKGWMELKKIAKSEYKESLISRINIENEIKKSSQKIISYTTTNSTTQLNKKEQKILNINQAKYFAEKFKTTPKQINIWYDKFKSNKSIPSKVADEFKKFQNNKNNQYEQIGKGFNKAIDTVADSIGNYYKRNSGASLPDLQGDENNPHVGNEGLRDDSFSVDKDPENKRKNNFDVFNDLISSGYSDTVDKGNDFPNPSQEPIMKQDKEIIDLTSEGTMGWPLSAENEEDPVDFSIKYLKENNNPDSELRLKAKLIISFNMNGYKAHKSGWKDVDEVIQYAKDIINIENS